MGEMHGTEPLVMKLVEGCIVVILTIIVVVGVLFKLACKLVGG